MKHANMKIILILITFCLISACGVGQKKILFTTQSNVGLDVDAKQLTAQINIDRQEAVIGPTFEGGKHVPIIAGFRNNNRLLGGFGVSSVFAGGEAAVKLTCVSTKDCEKDPELILSEAPVFQKGFIRRGFDMINPFTSSKDDSDEEYLPGPGQVKPFVFNTDTSLGIKLAWDPGTTAIPDKVQIGFKREEFALAPVMQMQTAHLLAFNPSTDIDKNKNTIKFGQGLNDGDTIIYHQGDKPIVGLNDGATYWVKLVPADTSKATVQLAASPEEWENESFIPLDATGITGTGYYFKTAKVKVGIPSFFAAIDTNLTSGAPTNSDFGFRQVFAVGKAATSFANDPKTKGIIIDKFGLGNTALCLSHWLSENVTPPNSTNLSTWLTTAGNPTTIESLINDSLEWKKFADKYKIICEN